MYEIKIKWLALHIKLVSKDKGCKQLSVTVKITNRFILHSVKSSLEILMFIHVYLAVML
jgi:hypothetical protein